MVSIDFLEAFWLTQNALCSKINASHCPSDLLWINTDGSVKMVWHQFDFITRNGHIYLAGVLSCKAKAISSVLTSM